MSEANEVNESPELPDPSYPEGYDPAQTFVKDENGKYIPPAKRLHTNSGPNSRKRSDAGKPKKAKEPPGLSYLTPVKIGAPRKYTDEQLTELSKDMLIWFAIPENIWLRNWAIEKGIPVSMLYVYAVRSFAFKESYAICKDMQESKLVMLGLTAKYSASAGMAMFALKNVSGWRDKQEITDTRQQVREVSLSVVTPAGVLTDGQAQNGEDSRKESTGLQESTISK